MDTRSRRGSGMDWETGIGMHYCVYHDFILLGFKITLDSDCSHEIKRRFLLRREVMTNLDKGLKSRDVILPTKICIVTARFFQKSHTDVKVGP